MRIFECVAAGAAFLGVVSLGGCRSGTDPGLRFRTSDGFTIAADLGAPVGGPPAPLIVLGHELDRTRRSWDPLVPRLVAAGYAVIAVDHRGCGESILEAPSVAKLSPLAREQMGQDLLAAIEAAAKDARVDATRVAVFGSGMSMSPAVQCAMGNEAVRTLVLFPGVLGADEEDHLLARPDLPLLLVAAAEDDRGAATQRAYAARFSGPPQNHLELQRVAPDEPADWRGTDGLLRDTGLADALLWFLESHFPASGSAGS